MAREDLLIEHRGIDYALEELGSPDEAAVLEAALLLEEFVARTPVEKEVQVPPGEAVL